MLTHGVISFFLICRAKDRKISSLGLPASSYHPCASCGLGPILCLSDRTPWYAEIVALNRYTQSNRPILQIAASGPAECGTDIPCLCSLPLAWHFRPRSPSTVISPVAPAALAKTPSANRLAAPVMSTSRPGFLESNQPEDQTGHVTDSGCHAQCVDACCRAAAERMAKCQRRLTDQIISTTGASAVDHAGCPVWLNWRL